MFDEEKSAVPILVIGVGNVLLGDDGTGIELVARLCTQAGRWGDEVEFLDGGTQGMALLSYIPGRSAIIFFDAVQLGAMPGTLHVMGGDDLFALGSRSSSAHEGNVGELLRTAKLLGDLPEQIHLIGVEPKTIETGLDLSEQVESAIPLALQAASSKIDSILAGMRDGLTSEGFFSRA